MTVQVDQASQEADTRPGEPGHRADSTPRNPGSEPDASRQDRPAPADETSALSEAIDRATAAVGQDDGKR